MTLKVTDTGSLALTEAELNMMQRLLDAHDRGAFYGGQTSGNSVERREA